MSDLTKDKVERAIAEINPNPPRYGQGIPSPEAAQTALAALDAVRWRNITDEQPTGDGEYPVLVKLKHTVMPEVMYYVPESGCAAFWRREYHYVTDELVSTDSIWWRYVDKWLPLPTWENETINRAFSEKGKADDDHRTAQS